jgi:surface protein
MFSNCEKLESVDISTFNTSNVTTMSLMFSQDYALKSVKIGNLDVSKVKNFAQMFYACKQLTSLDLSSFVTSSATYMTSMFAHCNSLTSLDISKFATSSVQYFGDMFKNCSSLKTLDLSHFSFSKAKATGGMLSGCGSLSTLTIPSAMTKVAADACTGIGSESKPCLLKAPQGFDYGADISGNYFLWKGGYFHVASDPRTAVDLGLSVKWATYNVGATTASDRGNYYAWGETSPKSKYTWANYAYADGSSSTVRDIGSDISGTSYDVAARLWGGDWRMPSVSEVRELVQRCTFTETTVGGVKGYRVKGPSGKTIFLPFTGCSYDGAARGSGTYAYYGCGDIGESSLQKAYSLFIKTGASATTPQTQRRTGIVIRPVQGAKSSGDVPSDENLQFVDLGLSVKWASQNINAGKESETGKYYAWGETSPKSTYTWANYAYAKGSSGTVTFIGADISQTAYDAAHLSDPSLALPTYEQWNELVSRCTWTPATSNGVKGYRVTGPSKKSIFLPLSGCSYDGKNVGVGSSAYYWSATNYPSDKSKARAILLKSGASPSFSNIQRRTGTAIRPVQSVAEYVDLGLPSGHLWARCNLGASSEEQTGEYYAWGELSAKTDYTWGNYKYGSSRSCENLGNISGNASYDPAGGRRAVVVKGSTTTTYVSRMPLKADFDELVSKCTVARKTVNGVAGLRFTGPNGNSIFLPFTGSWYDGNTHSLGESAFYWSGSIFADNLLRAYSLYIHDSTGEVLKCNRRTGLSIRPVYVPGSASANEAGFDTLDGIHTVYQGEGTQDTPVYNLQGMKMEGMLPPGVYIRNGKKFIVK